MKPLYVTKHFSEPGMRITTPAESTSVCLWLTPMGGGTTHHTTAQLTSPLMRLRSMMQLGGLSGRSAMLNVIVYMRWFWEYHSTCLRWWPYWHLGSGDSCTEHWPWRRNNWDR
jgi:hypothetical protein